MDAGKKAELDRLWRMICAKDKEVVEELATCRKQGRRTKRYDNLVEDARKLKHEYEQLKGTGVFNPSSVDHAERMERQAIVGKFLGRAGQDTHHGIGGEKDRNR